MAEMMLATAVLAVILLPLSYSFLRDQRLCRAYYYRAVAIEAVDGEMETLLAGEWRAFPKGTQPYSVRGEAARNLPPGRFMLTVSDDRIRLEWLPNKRRQGGALVREVRTSTAPPAVGAR